MEQINKFSNDTVAGANTGSSKLIADNQGRITQMVIMPLGYEFATKATALTKTTRQELHKTVKSNRHYKFPKFSNVTDKSTEPVMFNSPLKGEVMQNEGKIGFDFECFGENEVVLQKMRTFKNHRCLVSFFDENQNELMCTPDGTKVKGFEAIVYVTPRKAATGEEPGKYMVRVALQNLTEWADKKVILQANAQSTGKWTVSDLPEVYDVELTNVGTASATTATISVNIDAFTTDDSDGQIVGLPKANFVQKSSEGVVKTITGNVVDNGDGTYTITSSIASNDTFNLVACGSISLTDIAIESTGPVDVGTVV